MNNFDNFYRKYIKLALCKARKYKRTEHDVQAIADDGILLAFKCRGDLPDIPLVCVSVRKLGCRPYRNKHRFNDSMVHGDVLEYAGTVAHNYELRDAIKRAIKPSYFELLDKELCTRQRRNAVKRKILEAVHG